MRLGLALLLWPWRVESTSPNLSDFKNMIFPSNAFGPCSARRCFRAANEALVCPSPSDACHCHRLCSSTENLRCDFFNVKSCSVMFRWLCAQKTNLRGSLTPRCATYPYCSMHYHEADKPSAHRRLSFSQFLNVGCEDVWPKGQPMGYVHFTAFKTDDDV